MNRRGMIGSLVASTAALLAGAWRAAASPRLGDVVQRPEPDTDCPEFPGHRPFKPGDAVWYCESGRFKDLTLAVIVDSQVCGRSFLILEKSCPGTEYSFDDLSVIHAGKAWSEQLSHQVGLIDIAPGDPRMGCLVHYKGTLPSELTDQGIANWGVVIDIDKAKRTACVRWSLGELKLVPEALLR